LYLKFLGVNPNTGGERAGGREERGLEDGGGLIGTVA